MKPLKVNQETYNNLVEYLGDSPNARIKKALLNGHERRINGDGWEGYATFNQLTYEQMLHALTYGFEVDDIPDYEEIKKSIVTMNLNGVDADRLLKARRLNEFTYKSPTYQALNGITYEQLESALERIESEKENERLYNVAKKETSRMVGKIKKRAEPEKPKNISTLSAMIDVALDTGDKQWFMELTNELKMINMINMRSGFL